MKRAMAARRAGAGSRRQGRATAWAARRRFSDRGSATVLGVGVVAVLCAVFGLVLALGQAVIVRHRAAGGADLAALAAADHWAEGTAAACVRADRVARAQGTWLVRCVISGDVSDVTAASGAGMFAAEVRARAGPAGPEPGPGPDPTSSPGLGLNPEPSPGLNPDPSLRPDSAPGPGLIPAPSPGPDPDRDPSLRPDSAPNPGLDRRPSPRPTDASGAAVPDAARATGGIRPPMGDPPPPPPPPPPQPGDQRVSAGHPAP
ncbi:Rv3654c family TadE-like protein [Streptomyces sp. YIM S03343]